MDRADSEPFGPIALPGDAGVAVLERCDDHFYRKARSLSIPIQLKRWGLMSLADRPGLGLPEIYAALTTLTGPSGNLYDPWKGAFAFPFKLTVRRDGRELRYLLLLQNFRSMVEPCLYRVKRPGESYSLDQYHDPFDDELAEDDVEYLANYLRGFLRGLLETMRWTTPFVKEVRSNFILFGYDPRLRKFFAREYESQKQYEAALARLRKRIPEKSEAEKLDELDW